MKFPFNQVRNLIIAVATLITAVTGLVVALQQAPVGRAVQKTPLKFLIGNRVYPAHSLTNAIHRRGGTNGE